MLYEVGNEVGEMINPNSDNPRRQEFVRDLADIIREVLREKQLGIGLDS